MSTEADRIQAMYRETATADEPVAGTAGDPSAAGLTPDRILQIGQGYLRAKYMLVGIDVGLFQALEGDGATLPELAGRCGLSPRTTRILCDALVLWGLVELDGDRYRNAPDAEAFLTDRGVVDMRPMFRYFDKLSYPTWVNAAEAWRTEQGVRGPLTPEETEIYEKSLAFSTLPAASALPDAYDFGPHRRVLDVGGGTGSWLTALLGRFEHLSGTLLELPEVADAVRGEVATVPAGDRIEVVGADMFTDPIPGGHDVLLLADILHLFPPAPNLTLLRRLRDVVTGDGKLLIVDWYTGPDAHPATILLSGEWLTMSGGGAYRVEEIDEWFQATGWRRTDHVPLSTPVSVLIAEPV